MHVFIDFDYTLCNTNLVKAAIRALPSVYGWDGDRFLAAEQAVTDRGHYSLRAHLLEYGIPVGECAEIERVFFLHAPTWLYPDSIAFLKANAHHQFFVLSLGEPGFQHAKIMASGISTYIAGIDCVAEHKDVVIEEAIVEGAKEIVFVDDRPLHLDAVMRRFPHVTCVRMSRPESPYVSEISLYTTKTVHDLSWSVDGV